jgi:hypothetical protein
VNGRAIEVLPWMRWPEVSEGVPGPVRRCAPTDSGTLIELAVEVRAIRERIRQRRERDGVAPPVHVEAWPAAERCPLGPVQGDAHGAQRSDLGAGDALASGTVK